ncbi:MAG TPA: ATP-binding protein [Thermoanaerobaculia bacterium]
MALTSRENETGTSETCPDCGGRGWVVALDKSAGSATPCSCRQRDRKGRLLAAAGIPARYRHCKLASFQVSSGSREEKAQLLQAKTTAQQYVDDFLQPGGRFRESGLLFIGPPGAGKTHLAVAVLVAAIEKFNVHARFAEFTSLIHQIQSTFDPGSPESKREVLDPLIDAELLALDELGAQQPTPWVRDILYLIINNRYTRRLPTLFTTNYRLAPAPGRTPVAQLDRGRDTEPRQDEAALLTGRLSPMLVSRLYEMAQPVMLTGVEDFRREHAVHGAHLR